MFCTEGGAVISARTEWGQQTQLPSQSRTASKGHTPCQLQLDDFALNEVEEHVVRAEPVEEGVDAARCQKPGEG